MSTAEESRIDLASAARLTRQIRNEVCKALIGQDAVIDQVLVALFAAGHVLIEAGGLICVYGTFSAEEVEFAQRVRANLPGGGVSLGEICHIVSLVRQVRDTAE